MILFEKDIHEYQCTIDYSTANISFVKMSYLLKQMGIKNNKFMLALVQPELRGVDPFDPDLAEEQVLRIVAECKMNPWYFFREVVRIQEGGGDPVRYILNRANLALMWTHFNSVDIFLTIPRQIGKTIGVQGIMAYKMFVLCRNVNIGLFAKDNDLRMENVSRLKAIRDALPDYLQKQGPGVCTDNKEGLEFKPFSNKYMTFVAQNDRRKAAGQGRGQSFIDEHWDELGYYVNNHLSFPSAQSATDAAQPQARDNGIPCATIITTTAAMLEDPSGMYAHSMKCKAFRFTEIIYDCQDIDELTRLLKSSNQIIYAEFSYQQLGMGQEWWDRVTRNKTQDEIDRDYLNIWTHGASGSLINTDILKKLKLNTIEAVYTQIKEDLVLRWYVPMERLKDESFCNRPFILASDTADNVGRDATSLVLIDPSDMSVVMVCKSNQSSWANVIKVTVELMREYPRCVFIPERNKNGAVFIDLILAAFEGDHSFNPWNRIYNLHHQDYNSKSADCRRLDLASGSVRKLFGFTTGASSRKQLYQSIFTTVVPRNVDRIHDGTLIDEIGGITVDTHGRIDHTSDSHDDVLIAYLIACWFIMYGRNHHMYGIRENEILQDVTINDETIDPIERDRRNAQKKRVEYLEEMLAGTLSTMIRREFERELKYLKSTTPVAARAVNVLPSLTQVKEDNSKSYGRRFSPNEFASSLQKIRF